MTTAPVTLDQEINQVEHRSLWMDVWFQFSKHKGAMVGMVILIVFIIAAAIGPILWDLEPNYVDPLVANQGPTLAHPFGTDNLGRDLFAQMLAGARISLAVGVTAVFFFAARAVWMWGLRNYSGASA